jgi:hypothetical protein
MINGAFLPEIRRPERVLATLHICSIPSPFADQGWREFLAYLAHPLGS